MSTSIRGRLLAGILGLAVAAPLFACGDTVMPEALMLKAFHSLNPTADGCVHHDLPSSKGGYDVRLASLGAGDFTVYALLSNNLTSNEEAVVGRIDTKGVRVESFEITFDREGIWEFLPENLTVRREALIATGESMYLPVGAIPESVAKLMEAHNDIFAEGPVDLYFSVRANGTLLDGTEATSNSLGFVLSVCSGCLNPCGGGPVEAMCAAAAQPDAYRCTRTSAGG